MAVGYLFIQTQFSFDKYIYLYVNVESGKRRLSTLMLKSDKKIIRKANY
jgi:hypothetical protein